MVAAGLPSILRWLPYAVVGVLVVAILLARLHLGLTWFSIGVAGWLWALLWVIVLGAAYRRHTTQPPSSHGMATVNFVALAFAGLTYITTHYERDLARYTPQYTEHALETAEWWDGEWRDLPTYRLDMEGRQNQPLTVQWAGSLDTFAAVLIQHGWRPPPPLGSRALLQWLRPSPPRCQSRDVITRGFAHRLGYAWAGLREAWRCERCLRIQLVIAALLLPMLFVLRPAPLWWALTGLMAGLVIAAELINTALEHLIAHLHPERHPRIKLVKACAAAAGLVRSLAALWVAAMMAWAVM